MTTTVLPRDWPQGRSLAVSVSIMLEGWTEDGAPGIGPMGNPLKPGVLVLIENGERHEIRNTGRALLKTLVFYAPPAYTQRGTRLARAKP